VGVINNMNFIQSVKPPRPMKGPVWCFLFKDKKLLIAHTENTVSIPRVHDVADLPVTLSSSQYLGSLDGVHCLTGEIDNTSELPENMSFQGLRSLYGSLKDDLFAVAGRALQINDWDNTHQFCSKCGGRLVQKQNERTKSCPQCDLTFYPRLSPAIIVAVTRGDTILLAHAKRFSSGIYSVIAGFVEPGENLEECVQREIKEEVDIEIANIKYFDSQAWPFTNSLMIAFTAEYARGSIQVDGDEISDAGWFKANDLPEIPGNISIARKLIDWFVEQNITGGPSIDSKQAIF
jgi:NAD+ diphosphatase